MACSVSRESGWENTEELTAVIAIADLETRLRMIWGDATFAALFAALFVRIEDFVHLESDTSDEEVKVDVEVSSSSEQVRKDFERRWNIVD